MPDPRGNSRISLSFRVLPNLMFSWNFHMFARGQKNMVSAGGANTWLEAWSLTQMLNSQSSK